MQAVLVCYSRTQKHLNSASFSKYLLPVFMLLLRPAFSSRNVTIRVYLAFSAFTSKPTSLLVTNNATVFLYPTHNFVTQQFNISENEKLMCNVQFQPLLACFNLSEVIL